MEDRDWLRECFYKDGVRSPAIVGRIERGADNERETERVTRITVMEEKWIKTVRLTKDKKEEKKDRKKREVAMN